MVTSGRGMTRHERRGKGREREREQVQVGAELEGEDRGDIEAEGESEGEDEDERGGLRSLSAAAATWHGGECSVQTSLRAQVGGACAHVSLPRGRRGRAMDERGEWSILRRGTLSSPPFGSARTICHRLDARVWDSRSMRRGGRAW